MKSLSDGDLCYAQLLNNQSHGFDPWPFLQGRLERGAQEGESFPDLVNQTVKRLKRGPYGKS